MLVKFYWKKNKKHGAIAPYTPEIIDQEDYVREYECKSISEAWNIWAIDCHHRISRLKFEAYAVKIK